MPRNVISQSGVSQASFWEICRRVGRMRLLGHTRVSTTIQDAKLQVGAFVSMGCKTGRFLLTSPPPEKRRQADQV